MQIMHYMYSYIYLHIFTYIFTYYIYICLHTYLRIIIYICMFYIYLCLLACVTIETDTIHSPAYSQPLLSPYITRFSLRPSSPLVEPQFRTDTGSRACSVVIINMNADYALYVFLHIFTYIHIYFYILYLHMFTYIFAYNYLHMYVLHIFMLACVTIETDTIHSPAYSQPLLSPYITRFSLRPSSPLA